MAEITLTTWVGGTVDHLTEWDTAANWDNGLPSATNAPVVGSVGDHNLDTGPAAPVTVPYITLGSLAYGVGLSDLTTVGDMDLVDAADVSDGVGTVGGALNVGPNAGIGGAGTVAGLATIAGGATLYSTIEFNGGLIIESGGYWNSPDVTLGPGTVNRVGPPAGGDGGSFSDIGTGATLTLDGDWSSNAVTTDVYVGPASDGVILRTATTEPEIVNVNLYMDIDDPTPIEVLRPVNFAEVGVYDTTGSDPTNVPVPVRILRREATVIPSLVGPSEMQIDASGVATGGPAWRRFR